MHLSHVASGSGGCGGASKLTLAKASSAFGGSPLCSALHPVPGEAVLRATHA